MTFSPFYSCRSSAEVQVVMSETAGNATRGRGEDAWRLEPEGETLETKVVSNGVEGVHVDPVVKVAMRGRK